MPTFCALWDPLLLATLPHPPSRRTLLLLEMDVFSSHSGVQLAGLTKSGAFCIGDNVEYSGLSSILGVTELISGVVADGDANVTTLLLALAAAREAAVEVTAAAVHHITQLLTGRLEQMCSR